MFYFEENSYLVKGSILSAVLNIVLNFLLIPVFGYVVAGYTTLFSYIVFCSYQKKTYRYLILAICLHSMYDFPLVLLDYSVSPFIFEIGLFLFSAILLLFTLKGVRGIHSNEKNN